MTVEGLGCEFGGMLDEVKGFIEAYINPCLTRQGHPALLVALGKNANPAIRQTYQ